LPEKPKQSNVATLDIGSRLDGVERLVDALDGGRANACGG
jgi:hypothetical protein